jgi:hypothetical protein
LHEVGEAEREPKVPDVFGEGTTAVRASAEISDDKLGRLSDCKKLKPTGDVYHGVG